MKADKALVLILVGSTSLVSPTAVYEKSANVCKPLVIVSFTVAFGKSSGPIFLINDRALSLFAASDIIEDVQWSTRTTGANMIQQLIFSLKKSQFVARAKNICIVP